MKNKSQELFTDKLLNSFSYRNICVKIDDMPNIGIKVTHR